MLDIVLGSWWGQEAQVGFWPGVSGECEKGVKGQGVLWGRFGCTFPWLYRQRGTYVLSTSTCNHSIYEVWLLEVNSVTCYKDGED